MLKKLGTDLLVTELMGDRVNYVTGGYSRGAAGFWVENGAVQYPVDEVLLTPSQASTLDTLRHITPLLPAVVLQGLSAPARHGCSNSLQQISTVSFCRSPMHLIGSVARSIRCAARHAARVVA